MDVDRPSVYTTQSLSANGSRTSSLLSGLFLAPLHAADSDLDSVETMDEDIDIDVEVMELPKMIPKISLNVQLSDDSMGSDSQQSDDESSPYQDPRLSPNGTGPVLKNSLVADLARTVKRRASVAVWADDKLSQLAQSISAKESGSGRTSVGAAPVVSSSLAQDSNGIDDEDNEDDDALMDDLVDILPPQDKLGCIPREIVAAVLSHLDFHQLFKIRRLSSGFFHLLREPSLELMGSVDLSTIHKKVDDQVVSHVVNFCGPCIRSLNLRNCWQITDKGLLKIAQLCPNIETLILASVWDLTDAGVGIAAAPPSLKHLKHLDLSNCRKLSDAALQAVLGTASSLSSVVLSYCKSFGDGALDHPVWAKAKHLNLQRCTGITDAAFVKWEASGRVYEIRELILSDCSFLTDTAITSIAKCCPKLETLSLSFCCALTDTFASALVSGCPNLRVLDLSFCGGAVTNELLLLLSVGLPNLQKLSIRGCIQVTAEGVEHLKKSLSLSFVNFSQCKNVTVTAKDASLTGWTLLATGTAIIANYEGHWEREGSILGNRFRHERSATA
jgi:F-box/leucine-rich repeat protein 7